ncbi:hypothetical protein KSP35_17275 [Aquihabitans sp. G128]|uniref:type II secretion system F family protein n=1 Tax=Aquihabitans sp. G128 TaxID=2849779 RepID=UPI001C24441F|nr:hypothetical protein [Aquihabitans sp. G128]QXC60095.1 hypothetical protein KSP35_17275 [Aquihabitans sp. G128]
MNAELWAAAPVAAGVGASGAAALRAVRLVGSERARTSSTAAGAPPGAPPWFRAAMAAGDAADHTDRAWPIVRLAGIGAIVLVGLVAPLLVASAALVGVAALRVAPVAGRRAAARDYDVGLAAAVEAISAALRSGASVPQAVSAAGGGSSPAAADLAAVSRRHQRGERLQPLLDEWAAARAGTGAGLVADALALAAGAGGSRWRALAGVRASLAERAALQREVRALGSQARASAAVLVLAPLGFGVAAAAADPRLAAFLFATPGGWACLGGGLVLDAVGATWMAHQLRAVS